MMYKAFTGIDVSKNTLDVAILFPENKKTIHRKVGNDSCGYNQILSWLQEQCHTDDEILICMEHTGIYTNFLCKFLRENGLKFTVQSALHVKQSQGIRRIKSDKTDAEELARFAYLHHSELELTVLPTQTIELLRNLIAYRGRLIKCKIVMEVSSGELQLFSEKKVHLDVVRSSSQNIEKLTQSIDRIDKQILDTLKTEPKLKKQYDLITTIPGVGPQIAINTITYTKGFTSFADWRKFACFCGIVPFEHSSGTSLKGKNKISKLGNRHLKHLLSQGALVAINYDNEFSKYYEKKIKQGKHKMVVINIIRNKLLSRIFSVVKRGTPYINIPTF